MDTDIPGWRSKHKKSAREKLGAETLCIRECLSPTPIFILPFKVQLGMLPPKIITFPSIPGSQFWHVTKFQPRDSGRKLCPVHRINPHLKISVLLSSLTPMPSQNADVMARPELPLWTMRSMLFGNGGFERIWDPVVKELPCPS